MGTRKTQHPALPEPLPGDNFELLSRLKESLEIGRTDKRGDPLDRWVTIRDLVEGGLATFYDASAVRAGGVGPGGNPGGNDGLISGPPSPGSQFLQPFDPNKIRNLPGRPTNVRTVSLWDSIMVKWDWPDEAGNNVDWLGAVIWMSATVNFEEGSLAGYSRSNFWVHEDVGLSTNGDIGVRYYWVAWFAQSDPDTGEATYPWGSIPGVGRQTQWTPYHYEPGIRGQTSIDPEYVLRSLRSQITESQIYASLNTRINLIDFDENGNQYSGSVQSRILAATAGIEGRVYAAIAQYAGVSISGGVARGEFNVRLDLNGYIVGFGLSALANIDGNGTYGETSTFIVKAQSFAIVYPKAGRDDVIIPFIVGLVDGVSTVGIDGQLVVDGTITATQIQANSIGVTELNAEAIWAKMATFDQVYTGALSTSIKPAMRLEINGRGQNETFPLWFGRGEVGITTIPGYSEPAFFFTNTGDMVLAGELRVTGAGKFYIGQNNVGEYRVEIGGFDNNTLFYVGADDPINLNDDGNWILWIDKNGDAEFRGRIKAEFVSGEISRTGVINEFGQISGTRTTHTKVANITTGDWTLIGEYTLPASPFDPHLPTINITCSFYGSGVRAGALRILYQGVEIMRTAIDLYRYGGMHNFQATAPAKVPYVTRFRVEFCGFDGNAWIGNGPIYTNNRNGYVLGIR